MNKKIKNIYEYFCEYSEEEINNVISNLSIEEKLLIKERYGNDLHNPITSSNFTRERSLKYYSSLVPKIKKLLTEERKRMQLNDEMNLKIQLMHLINEKKSKVEICEILHINNKQLYDLLLDLKNNGQMLLRKYYSNGSIQYKLIKTFQSLTATYSQDKTIITEPDENKMTFLVMSDLHFGNSLERLDLINRAYNYCIKNGINIILLGGDLIDGTFTKEEQKVSNLSEQIEYFIKNYPYDKNILNIGVAGDHDFSAFTSEGLNIIYALNNYRHDIAIGGFNNTGVNIKNDQILLFHSIASGNLRNTKAPIVLHGHSHKYKTNVEYDKLHITIPSLSNIMNCMPTALELNIIFNKGYITNANVKQIYFGNKDIVLNESEFDLLTNREINYEPIRNIEVYRNNNQTLEETKNAFQPQLSQIEKFNKRYSR